MRKTVIVLVGLLLVSMFAACSDDATRPASPRNDGTIHGQIGDSDFEFEIGGGEPGDPIGGPFVLRGTNLHYDDEAGALVVDLTIINHGPFPHHEPVGLTFIQLEPDDVTVIDPDNDIHGDGAAIVFHFANDDGVWTPGEASIPRTVQFGVEKGVSIAFVARLDLGAAIDGGSISGLVWNDANRNGLRENDEPGIPGVGIYLFAFSGGGNDGSTVTPEFYTVTGRDGRYVFEHLNAGGYVVSKGPSTAEFFPTTPTEIHVLLVETNGEVSNYDGANFGCVPQSPPPPGIHRVHVTGKFLAPDRFVTATFESVSCPDDTIPIPGDPRNDPPEHDCFDGRLRGSVTEVAAERHAFRVMATWVSADASTFPPDLKVGTRVDVHVHPDATTHGWVVDSLERWADELDEIEGRVEAIDYDPSGHIRLRVLDTWIDAPDVTVGGR